MTTSRARWMALLLVGVYIVLLSVGLTLQGITGIHFDGMDIPVLAVFYTILGIWPVLGALIVWHHPRHPAGWIWCAGMPFPALDMFAFGYAAYGLTANPGSLPGLSLALVWLNLSGMPFGMLTFTLLALIFPTGRLLSPAWKKVGRIAAGALVLYFALKAAEPGPVLLYPQIPYPLGVDPTTWAVLNPLRWLAFGVLSLCLMSAIGPLLIQLRRGRGDVPQQVKWLIFPFTLFVIGAPIVALGEYEPSGILFTMGGSLHMVAVAGMVVATAFAIFRYRLYDIDTIINRTLVYGALTGTLALVYLTSVVLLQQIFPARSQFAIVLSTLAIAALFSPLRRRIQDAIDRRFYRRRYDAERAIASFGAAVGDQVDLEALSDTLLATVGDALEPTHISLWIREWE